MDRRERRSLRPSVEGMESRQLLSGIVASLVSQRPQPIMVAAAGTSGGGSGQGAGSGFPGPTQGNSVRTPLLGEGQPTPHEQARQAFKAYFNGPFSVGPGRFSDQASILYIRG